jgi:hypothetical protein
LVLSLVRRLLMESNLEKSRARLIIVFRINHYSLTIELNYPA